VVDENIIRWLEAKFEHFESYLAGIDKKCTECRAHCDASRSICKPRIDILEKAIIAQREIDRAQNERLEHEARDQAALWTKKGAWVIGISAGLATILGLFIEYVILKRWVH
jgi:hypothetical protein